jgi:radical SAM superfamily enzyme YgiQ (UPF0313 family)
MNKDDILESLRELAINDASRSETARLRDIFDGIEGALAAGVKTEVVLETLHKQGFTLALSGFRSAIQRIRKERKNKQREKYQPFTTQATSQKEADKQKPKTTDEPKTITSDEDVEKPQQSSNNKEILEMLDEQRKANEAKKFKHDPTGSSR